MEENNKNIELKNLIHLIRGQQVMLDSDLAKLYGTEVKKLIQQVKRNSKKFPSDFMFQLTEKEMIDISRSQNVTSIQTKGIKGGRSYKPYVFTEQGIYMVATILKNDIATQQSIYIMRSFKEMKHYVAENKILLNNEHMLNITNRLAKHEEDIQEMKNVMATKTDINAIMDHFINEDKIKEKLFLDGQIFDATEAYIQIYQQATKNIYIIDGYISITTLSMLKHKQKNVAVIIFTKDRGNHNVTKLEIERFHKQYPTLEIRYTNKFHDRFIILDYNTKKEKAYLCGASSKDAGKKVCTITRLYDNKALHHIIAPLLQNKY